jgi:tetratricopeptide (TPR) repeat protein
MDIPARSSLEETKQALLDQTGAFCDSHLNADYKRLCKKLIGKMAKEKPAPFMRGREDIWAAGIVHALGAANFLFDRNTKPYVSAADLAAAFGVATGSVTQKATLIRDRYEIDFPNLEFATKQVKEQLSPLLNEMMEMVMLTDGTIGAPAPAAGLSRRDGQFIDSSHAVSSGYYDLCEEYQGVNPSRSLVKKLETMIAADPDFYDPYLMLGEILDQQGASPIAEALLETAYQRALSRIQDKKGNWPKRLEWGWLENRHIIRTLLTRAIRFWEEDDTEAALELFRNLLKTNPNDNIGARYYILAIRLGQTLDEHEAPFRTAQGFLDAMKMVDWFDANAPGFPEEFDAWWKEMETEEDDA